MECCTVDQMMAFRPCGWDKDDDGKHYTPQRVAALWAGRETLTAMDMLDLDIPADDRLWAVLRPELIPEKMLHELACDFAAATLYIWEKKYPNDKRPHNTIAVKRLWIRGEATDDELAAARAAAGDAAGAAAGDAAWVAAGVAAWFAAGVAAGAAAGAAAWAAWAAAGDDARDAQVDMVREALKQAEKGKES